MIKRGAPVLVFLSGIAVLLLIIISSSKASSTSVTFDGYQWEPIGQAELVVENDGLRVNNVGTSGQDGARQILPSGYVPGSHDPFHRVVEDGIQLPGSPEGAFIRVAKIGTLNGSPGQVISSATMLVHDGCVRREANLVPLAPSSVTAEYLQDGVVVATETGLPALCVADDTIACPLTPDSCDESGAFDWFWPPNEEKEINKYGDGGGIYSDLVRLVPLDCASTVSSLSSIDWTAAGVSGFLLKPVQ